jgi:hypothetical protein
MHMTGEMQIVGELVCLYNNETIAPCYLFMYACNVTPIDAVKDGIELIYHFQTKTCRK